MSPASGPKRIVWLAAADARGHLMRAHLMRQLLARRGVQVDILTTSADGAAFLNALGSPCEMLSQTYRVEFDERQNMDRLATEARVLAYLLSPNRFWRDLRTVKRLARGAEFVVNDFHPLLLLAHAHPRLLGELRVVHLFGENLRAAIAGNYQGRGLQAWADLYESTVEKLIALSFARVEHTLDPDAIYGRAGKRCFRLPAMIDTPQQSVLQTRTTLGVPEGKKLAVVYLNPHFRDPTLAESIEGALASQGYFVHAVCEGYASSARPGWRAHDSRLVEAIAAADVVLSAPGMGVLGQVRTFRVPFVALVTDQPEQRANLAFLQADHGLPQAVVPLEGNSPSQLRAQLDEALTSTSNHAPVLRLPPQVAAAFVQEKWAGAFEQLLQMCPSPIQKRGNDDARFNLDQGAGAGNEQPQRRRTARTSGEQSGEVARSPSLPDAAARGTR
jgi:hypothetical protein